MDGFKVPKGISFEEGVIEGTQIRFHKYFVNNKLFLVWIDSHRLNPAPPYETLFEDHKELIPLQFWRRNSSTYIVLGPNGNYVVEPGYYREGDEDLQARLEFITEYSPIRGIIRAHPHFEHWAAEKPLIQMLMGVVSVYGHLDSEEASIETIMGNNFIRDVNKKVFEVDYGLFTVSLNYHLPFDNPLKELGWEAIYAPGHCPGLVVFYNEDLKALMCSDLLHMKMKDGEPKVHVSAIAEGGNKYSFLTSLRIVTGYNFDWILPGHGAPYFEDGLSERLNGMCKDGTFSRILDTSEQGLTIDWKKVLADAGIDLQKILSQYEK